MTAQPVKKTLRVFSLVMLNIVAVDSLRSIPFASKYGFTLVFYYAIAAIFFFIPTALVAAELATGWPRKGGIYIWVREAFGLQWGVVTIWLQWVYNICWFPVILSLLAATLAYLINPALVHSKSFMLSAIVIMFVCTTIANSYGMRASSVVTNIASLLGSLVPMVLITLLGIIWLASGHKSYVIFDWHHFWPHHPPVGTLVLLTNVLFSLVGVEMSAIHASEVKNPQKSYPRALLISTVIILVTLIGGSLAIAIVIPKAKIELMSGMLQVFSIFFHTYHMKWLLDVVAACIILGGFGGVTAWVLGPSKGLMVAANDGGLPRFMAKQNRHAAPIAVLISQLIIFLIICSVYLYMPTVGSSFWVLSNIAAILSLSSYVFMFAAVIMLRYRHPGVKRAYRIPGGKIGVWVVALFGIISCVTTIVIGLFPPKGVVIGSVYAYEATLLGGVLFFFLIPFVIYWVMKRAAK